MQHGLSTHTVQQAARKHQGQRGTAWLWKKKTDKQRGPKVDHAGGISRTVFGDGRAWAAFMCTVRERRRRQQPFRPPSTRSSARAKPMTGDEPTEDVDTFVAVIPRFLATNRPSCLWLNVLSLLHSFPVLLREWKIEAAAFTVERGGQPKG